MNNQDNKILASMIEELQNSGSIYQPSFFWKDLNDLHIKYLSEHGLYDFKSSVNSKYFQWGTLGIIVHQLIPMISGVIKGRFAPLFRSGIKYESQTKKNGPGVFNYYKQLLYKVYTASLYEFIRVEDKNRLLDKIEEPLFGNPILVSYKNKLLTQDLCNSVYEYYSITKRIRLRENVNIAEIGAGYGRLGYVLLKVLPGSSYCIIDIPPALFISQNYLSKVFPKEKIFKFRPFKSFKEIKKEFEESSIKFLMPHQIRLLPRKYFDLFINISSLHEMTRKQIKYYFSEINRLSKGYFYTKQWRKSRTSDNQFIREDEYPIPKNWRIMHRRRRHPIQNMFFDSLYKIR
ncbi:hypothetical protein A3D83_01210 [Candidatus Daviesbacteria bacterium RIFCSPHIGHO2_02_FULL_41_10]|uniref:Sugar O-methyltransferase n=1 Tax=Candidatus Daviesbacteria bacterium RIFCSPHIGHO2_02_FULL_41_10 TaxID=1797774 RepID=A0A1F5JY49_9BACT|nr:MAG: hypothetical protein A3D83_01210 [Candidatus Daviesbacteria bacterium RIFCSPHIGHO2_02_FULL_41_10]